MTGKHTETPWVADFEYTDEGSKARVFRNAAYQYALTEYGTMSDEDAAFIVRAVNAHEGLVAALENIAKRAVPHPDDTDADRKRDLLHCEYLARAALSAAKE